LGSIIRNYEALKGYVGHFYELSTGQLAVLTALCQSPLNEQMTAMIESTAFDISQN